MIKKIKGLWVLCIAILLVGCTSNKEELPMVEEEPIQQKQKGVEVYGNVKAMDVMKLVIDFPVTVVSLPVKNGHAVMEGDVLAVLDFEPYKNEILRKEKEIGLLESQLQQVEKGLDPSVVQANQIKGELSLKQDLLNRGIDPDLVIVQGQIELAEKKYQVAQKAYELNLEMLEIGAISEAEYEALGLEVIEAQNARDHLNNQVANLKNNKELEIDALKTTLKTYEIQASNTNVKEAFEATQLQIRIQIAQIELADMKAKLMKPYLKDNTIIATSPKGIVYDLMIQEGEIIGVQQRAAILQIADQQSFVATVDVPQIFINKVQIGSKATVRLNDETDDTFEGKVTYIANMARFVDGENMVEVDIALDNSAETFKLGYEVDVIIY